MNPLLGRWISADPLEVHSPGAASLNVYSYVDGSVLASVDPNGLALTTSAVLIGVAIGAVVGGGTGAAFEIGAQHYQNRNNQEAWSYNLGKIGIAAGVGVVFGAISSGTGGVLVNAAKEGLKAGAVVAWAAFEGAVNSALSDVASKGANHAAGYEDWSYDFGDFVWAVGPGAFLGAISGGAINSAAATIRQAKAKFEAARKTADDALGAAHEANAAKAMHEGRNAPDFVVNARRQEATRSMAKAEQAKLEAIAAADGAEMVKKSKKAKLGAAAASAAEKMLSDASNKLKQVLVKKSLEDEKSGKKSTAPASSPRRPRIKKQGTGFVQKKVEE